MAKVPVIEDVPPEVAAFRAMTPVQRSLVLRLVRGSRRFPGTTPANLLGRIRSLERRRAKNRVARRSRKANRGVRA